MRLDLMMHINQHLDGLHVNVSFSKVTNTYIAGVVLSSMTGGLVLHPQAQWDGGDCRIIIFAKPSPPIDWVSQYIKSA